MLKRFASAAVLLLAMQSAAQAQTLSGGDPGPDVSLWRIIAALLLCVGLAIAAVFAMRRRFGAGGGLVLFANRERRMHLVECIRPSPALGICLIRCDDKEYLVAVGPQGGSLIQRIDPPKRGDQDQ
jgi:hypothetical protein